MPKPGDKDTSDASRPADEEGPKGHGTPADIAKGGARELANGIPNASYYEFSKLGHAAFIESKQFNKMILEFP